MRFLALTKYEPYRRTLASRLFSLYIFGIVGEIICGVHVVMMVLVVHPTERALKKNFDKDGNRRINDSE